MFSYTLQCTMILRAFENELRIHGLEKNLLSDEAQLRSIYFTLSKFLSETTVWNSLKLKKAPTTTPGDAKC